MKNYKSDGGTVDYTVAGTLISSGDMRLIGVNVHVATKDGAIGDVVPMLTKGVVEYTKQAALAVAIGAKVYHDSGADEVDATNTNDFAGYCHAAAASGDANIQVRLAAVGD